jgi:hypothetical protein
VQVQLLSQRWPHARQRQRVAESVQGVFAHGLRSLVTST